MSHSTFFLSNPKEIISAVNAALSTVDIMTMIVIA